MAFFYVRTKKDKLGLCSNKKRQVGIKKDNKATQYAFFYSASLTLLHGIFIHRDQLSSPASREKETPLVKTFILEKRLFYKLVLHVSQLHVSKSIFINLV